jgi:hypothetical protein
MASKVRGGHHCESQRDSISSSPRLPRFRGYLGSTATARNNPERVESPQSNYQFATMPQSLAKILLHLVFSTKERRPFLKDPALREELNRYLQ